MSNMDHMEKHGKVCGGKFVRDKKRPIAIWEQPGV
jgi:hypothetical protein